MFADNFNLYDISGLGSNSLKEGEDKYETLPNKKMITKMKEYIIIFVMKELEMK